MIWNALLAICNWTHSQRCQNSVIVNIKGDSRISLYFAVIGRECTESYAWTLVKKRREGQNIKIWSVYSRYLLMCKNKS